MSKVLPSLTEEYLAQLTAALEYRTALVNHYIELCKKSQSINYSADYAEEQIDEVKRLRFEISFLTSYLKGEI